MADEDDPLTRQPAKQDRDGSKTRTEERVPPLKDDQRCSLRLDDSECLDPGKRVHGINNPVVFHSEDPAAVIELRQAWKEQARVLSGEADQVRMIVLLQGKVEHGGVMGDASSKRMSESDERDATRLILLLMDL